MRGRDDEASKALQAEFLEYLRLRLGVELEEAAAMLSDWLVNHPHRGRPGSVTSFSRWGAQLKLRF